MATTTYSDRGWHPSHSLRKDEVEPSRRQRSAVVSAAIAVAAIGVLGYLGYVGATTPELNDGIPQSPPAIARFSRGPDLLVRLQLGLAETQGSSVSNRSAEATE